MAFIETNTLFRHSACFMINIHILIFKILLIDMFYFNTEIKQ